MKKILLIYVVLISCICPAQEVHPLELHDVNLTCRSMTIHKCFEKDLHSLLLECSSNDHKFYKLNDTTGEILPIIIDKSFSPISFYADDTLFLRNDVNNKYFFYDITSSMVSDINRPTFLSILSVLPQDFHGRVNFNSALTECVYWNDKRVLRVRLGEKENHLRIDTLFTTQDFSPITQVFNLSDSIYVINRFNVQTMEESSSLFNVKQKHIKINKYDFLINDCLNGYCIAWKDGNCYMCRFDNNTLELKIGMPISASGGLYGRLGFLSKNTIVWYTGVSLDYDTFEPLLNQQNLLKVED